MAGMATETELCSCPRAEDYRGNFGYAPTRAQVEHAIEVLIAGKVGCVCGMTLHDLRRLASYHDEGSVERRLAHAVLVLRANSIT
jgi:hypothetical protein